MGTAGAKAFGDVLRVNKTLQHLNVSNNSFGRPVVGDHVKLKSSGETCTVLVAFFIRFGLLSTPSGERLYNIKQSDCEWESQVPAFCAGLAASASLLSVSDSMWCSGRLLPPCGGAGG